MEQFELKSTLRSSGGKGPSRRLRSNGMVPAVLYGAHTDSILLSISAKDLETCLKNTNQGHSLIALSTDDKKRMAMIKSMQIHPVTGRFQHVDFYEVDMNRKVRAKVAVVLKGKAKGVEFGGMLQQIRRQIEVLCLPSEIPEVIEIDVTSLDIGDAVHAKDIQMPAGAELPDDANFTVATVLGKKSAGPEVAGEKPAEESAES